LLPSSKAASGRGQLVLWQEIAERPWLRFRRGPRGAGRAASAQTASNRGVVMPNSFPPLAVVILAAGQGTRMRSKLPKVLHAVGGRAMLDWSIDAAAGAGAARTVVVVGPHSPSVGAHAEQRLGAASVAMQREPLGTAHAVRAAEAALRDFVGDVAVIFADSPLIRADHLQALQALRAQADIVALGFEAADPRGYGRLLRGPDGGLEGIVEDKDATAEQRAITLCNSGVLLAPAERLWALLAQVDNANAKGEYYLTDIVRLGRAAGLRAAIALGEEADVLGVNSRAQLAQAEAAFQARARAAAMEAGVTLIDPATVYFSFDTALEQDVLVEPNVFFGPGVRVEAGARIRAFSHLEGAQIGPGCEVGPFARLRPGARLGEGAKIGNFVEVKNATLGPGAKANHLTYLGDADVGARANIGAGTITCNYDGFFKYRTTIGEEAFIGSDTALVAPVRVGARAYTGSGSVITKDVPEGALSVARGRQKNLEGWADRFRAAAQKKKGEGHG